MTPFFLLHSTDYKVNPPPSESALSLPTWKQSWKCFWRALKPLLPRTESPTIHQFQRFTLAHGFSLVRRGNLHEKVMVYLKNKKWRKEITSLALQWCKSIPWLSRLLSFTQNLTNFYCERHPSWRPPTSRRGFLDTISTPYIRTYGRQGRTPPLRAVPGCYLQILLRTRSLSFRYCHDFWLTESWSCVTTYRSCLFLLS